MAYYIIFDESNNYLGYTTNKKYMKRLQSERMEFQRFNVKKVPNNEVTEDFNTELFNSEGELFDYYGTMLFEFEQDEVHNTCMKTYKDMYNIVTSLDVALNFIKMDDTEKEILIEFMREMNELRNSMELDYLSSEDPYWRGYDSEKLCLSIVKELHKQTKKKVL